MVVKVLVVEDKVALNEKIVDVLEREGYSAYGVVDIKGAKEMFLAKKPNIVLLDIMLPDGKGPNLIPFFRESHDSRILMLTALSDSESKHICYKNGADDYITKPFDLEEVIYKLHAIRTRIISETKEYEVGDVSINELSNELMCNGRKVVMQPSQVKFFKLLYEKHRRNSYVNKAELTEGFLMGLDDSHRIQTLVGRLRKNLEYVKSEQVCIETIYGKGYQLDIIQPLKKKKMNNTFLKK